MNQYTLGLLQTGAWYYNCYWSVPLPCHPSQRLLPWPGRHSDPNISNKPGLWKRPSIWHPIKHWPPGAACWPIDGLIPPVSAQIKGNILVLTQPKSGSLAWYGQRFDISSVWWIKFCLASCHVPGTGRIRFIYPSRAPLFCLTLAANMDNLIITTFSCQIRLSFDLKRSKLGCSATNSTQVKKILFLLSWLSGEFQL